MGPSEIRRALRRIIHEIIEKNKGTTGLVFIGIKRRGDFVARRIADMVKKDEGKRIPLGALDITLYRDDLQLVSETPIIESTDITFDLSKKRIVLVDDVLYTGRTIRAAMEEIFNFGRPHSIQLAVLVDRGHRELPIQADYVGKKVPTARNEIVDVLLEEVDGEDCVLLHRCTVKRGKDKERSKKTRIQLKGEKGPKIKQLSIGD